MTVDEFFAKENGRLVESAVETLLARYEEWSDTQDDPRLTLLDYFKARPNGNESYGDQFSSDMRDEWYQEVTAALGVDELPPQEPDDFVQWASDMLNDVIWLADERISAPID